MTFTGESLPMTLEVGLNYVTYALSSELAEGEIGVAAKTEWNCRVDLSQ